MASPEVVVFATVVARPGKAEEVSEVLSKLLEPSRGEAGCISYNLHQDTADKHVFVFHEIWNCTDDLKEHEHAPHYRAAVSRLSELTVSVDVKRTVRVDS